MKETAEPAVPDKRHSQRQEDRAAPGETFETKTIHTPLYTASISAKGAAITGFVLEKYKENIDDPNVGKQLIPSTNPRERFWSHWMEKMRRI